MKLLTKQEQRSHAITLRLTNTQQKSPGEVEAVSLGAQPEQRALSWGFQAKDSGEQLRASQSLSSHANMVGG